MKVISMWEILQNQYVQHLLVGVVRACVGWGENSIENGAIEKFEIKKLGATVLRVGLLSVALALTGAPIGSAIPVDMGFFALKKAGTE